MCSLGANLSRLVLGSLSSKVESRPEKPPRKPDEKEEPRRRQKRPKPDDNYAKMQKLSEKLGPLRSFLAV